jgi:type III secretion system YscD/HrpQ family protein
MTAHLIAEEGPLKGLILNLAEDTQEWVVGKSPESADLVLEDETLSRKHAKLYRVADGIYLENFSKLNPVHINRHECLEPTLLKEGDLIQIGETLFLFSEVTHAAPLTPEFQTEDLSSDDTIFEDIPSETDLPFSLPPNTPYLLKVISGPNAGAEIGIEKGHSYTLGKDPKVCDILFQDLSVSRSHAKLFVEEDGTLEIEDLSSKNGTAINGEPVTGKRSFTSQDLVALGTTIFLIIDRDAPQETIYSPLTPSHETHTPSPQEAIEETPLEKTETDWKQQPIPLKYLLLIGSVAAIFLVCALTFFSLFKAKQTELVQKEPVSEIKEALNHKKFAKVEFVFNPAGGTLFLVGHVITNTDYQEMRYHLSQIPFILNVEDSVVIDDGVAKQMNDILSSNEDFPSITIRVAAPGKFIATGYVETNEEVAQITEYLTINFPYLDLLENNIVSDQMLEAQIQSELMGGGFSAVSYELSRGQLVLSGLYDHKKTSSYEHLLKTFSKMPAITSVKNLAIPTSSKLAAINLSSRYQVAGVSTHDHKGFNAILNGKIYTLGDWVDGMLITEIEANTILLEKDGIKYRIDYKAM